MKSKQSVLIIGAGIVGQSIALAEASKRNKVTVIDRSSKTSGSSIRNFGLCWPIGQAAGFYLDIALGSKAIWESIAKYTGMYLEKKGSLHIAQNEIELGILEDFQKKYSDKGYQIKLLTTKEAKKISPGLKEDKVLGAMYSKTELVMDPRESMQLLPIYLKEKFKVKFLWETTALHIEDHSVYTSKGETIKADKIYICNGSDFETLFPEIFLQAGITKCKIQMMRSKKQPGNWRIGPTISTGLTFVENSAFSNCKGVPDLRKFLKKEMPDYLKKGIQVMVSQMPDGAINIGSSHEYGWSPDPFDKKEIYEMILKYLDNVFEAPVMDIAETWHSVYSKSTRGENVLVHPVNEYVTIVNAMGSSGITLAPGLAEKITSGNFKLSNLGFVSGKR